MTEDELYVKTQSQVDLDTFEEWANRSLTPHERECFLAGSLSFGMRFLKERDRSAKLLSAAKELVSAYRRAHDYDDEISPVGKRVTTLEKACMEYETSK